MKAVAFADDSGWLVMCPACACGHRFDKRWTFNGDVEKPTFSPSMKITSGHYMTGHTGPCWCTYNAEHPDEPVSFKCGVCHSFVRDGRIQYLDDCTHAMSGQTVDLPDVAGT